MSEKLGCYLARRYDDRITLDFFGDQLVCHLSDETVEAPSLYPRHFGITFRRREDFDASCSAPRPATLRSSPPASPGSRTGWRNTRRS